MALVTLANTKGKLEIPTADISEDGAIQLVVDAVNQFIYDRTGYDDVATAHTEYFENQQIGRAYELAHRPVDTALTITAQGRPHSGVSSQSWSDLVPDVVDPDQGRVYLLGVSNFFQSFPPIEPPNPIFRWQQPIWPVVKWVYTTKAKAGLAAWPADLIDAGTHWASFLYRQGLTSHLSSASLGPISESYAGRGEGDPIPTVIRSIIDRYSIKKVQWTP